MGYRSQVFLKTTTEGYLAIKKYNDSIKTEEERPLRGAEIIKAPSGNYKIYFDDVKWYDSYPDVQNFNHAMDLLDEQDIPYSFIRLGEDIEDIETRRNYTDDIPYEIEAFEPVVDVNDEEYGYEPVE